VNGGFGGTPAGSAPNFPEPGPIVADGGILSLEEVERRYLAQVASRYPADRERLAENLGISRRTLFRKLQRRPE
jgi:DNA-binding NtrC family response regulator